MAQVVSREGEPVGAAMKLAGAQALAAAAPVMFLPLAFMALAFEDAPALAIGVAVLGVAPLVVAAGVGFSRPLAARTFVGALLVFAIATTWLAWASGGVLSPATPWVFAGLAGVAMLGGATGALIAAGVAVALAAFAALGPEPPMRLMGFAPRVEREAIAAVSWALAAASTFAIAWAAGRAAAAALPPLRHPTIAARKSLAMLTEGAALCGLRLTQTNHIAQTIGAAERTLEFGRDELRSLSLDALAHPDDVPAIDALRRTALETGEPAPATIRMRSRLGGYRWLEATAMPARDFPPPSDGPGAADDVILLVRDRWRQGGDASPSSEFDRAGFLAHMGADLKNAAKSIVGFTDILKNELFGPLGAERYREYARLANEGGLELNDRIEELLDLANIEAGRYAARTDTVEIGPLIDGAIRLARQRGEAAGVALSANAAAGATSITIDRRALRRVLQAMLLDAVRRVHVGDTIRLDAAIEDGAARFAVVATVAPRQSGAEEDADAETKPAAKAWPAHVDAAQKADAPTLAEARLGRMVASSLSDVLGGTLFFIEEVESDDGLLAEGETTVAEAIMPLAPNETSTDAPPVAAIGAVSRAARAPVDPARDAAAPRDAASPAFLRRPSLAASTEIDDFVATEIETASGRSATVAPSRDQAPLFSDADLPKIEAEATLEDQGAQADAVARGADPADDRDRSAPRDDAPLDEIVDTLEFGTEELPLFDLAEPENDGANASWDDTDRTRSRIRKRLTRRLPA